MAAWRNLTFASLRSLTGAKLKQILANFSALAAGATGAPKFQVPAYGNIATGTTGSLGVGGTQTITVTHGLGSDDVAVVFYAKNNTGNGGDWNACWARPDGKCGFAGEIQDGTLLPTIPASGNVAVKIQNRGSTGTISYTIIVMKV
jgi:hypothetical protein